MNQVDPFPPRPLPGFRYVPRTGVIYVMHRAAERGYRADDPSWVNLGQGSPECGPLAGAPPRQERLDLDVGQLAYGPVGGTDELRARVAAFYNHFHRHGLASQYTAENVSICGGGRAAMTRVVASMGDVNLGHLIPDYTAYEELLTTFKGFVPIPILLDKRNGYRPSAELLREEILGRGLSAVLASNPSNPTGNVTAGNQLLAWVDTARECRSTLVLDEFYSHYVYPATPPAAGAPPPMVSAAVFVDDVDRDPVVLVDGLTKNWRYPGLRISWIVGPRAVIEQVTSAGSVLDGGASHPFQRRAVELLEPAHVVAETRAIQAEFRAKRAFMLERLGRLGITVDALPGGAFYVWGNLAGLPAAVNDGMRFFEAALEHRVITVPGEFFDVNPGRRRAGTRYQTYSRFSFGPERPALERGLDALERMLAR